MPVKTTEVLRYSLDDYEQLKNILIDLETEQSKKHHSGKPVNKSWLLSYVEHILYEHDYSKEMVDCWLNISCRKMLYKAPLLRMPLCINSPRKSTRIIAKWRLQISK